MKRTTEECQLHGAAPRSGNRMLLTMLIASITLIIWHVWTYGPTSGMVQTERVPYDLPALVGAEIWDLLFNRKGIAAELREVFPYFIVGVLIAGYLRTYKIAVRLQASLRKYGVMSVFLASFVGIITPLCACGTITTAISLLYAGIPLAPVMALMVTSPLLSPSTYLLTLNDLGPEWTVVRTVSALSMGIFAGLLTHFLSKRGFKTEDIFIEGAIVRGDFHDDEYPDERLRCNCRRQFGNRVAVKTGNKFIIFLAKSAEMLWTVGKYILVGVTVGAVVERYMPQEWIYHFFGRKDPLSIVWVTLGSVPMFLHQVSASSILYHIKSSLNGTLDSGAALAFMIGGPVTAVPTMVLFWTFFKKRVFFLYMFACLAGTMLIAYTFQGLLFVPGVDMGNPLLKGVGTLTGGSAAVVSKSNPNVRMVMDPGGNGLVATYTNDLESSGAVVFDGGPARFLDVGSRGGDNSRYVVNVAEWLERNNTSAAKTGVYIHRVGTLRSGALLPGNDVVSTLQRSGFSVQGGAGNPSPRLDASRLAEASQLWIFFGDGGAGLTEDEVKTVARFSSEGKGIVIVSGGNGSANGLAQRFGVTFSGVVEHGREIPVSVSSRFLGSGAEIVGRILKIVRKA